MLNNKKCAVGEQTYGKKVIDKVFRYIDPKQELSCHVDSLANVLIWYARLSHT